MFFFCFFFYWDFFSNVHWTKLIYFNLNNLFESWRMRMLQHLTLIRWFKWNIISMILVLDRDALRFSLSVSRFIFWVLSYWFFFFEIVISCCYKAWKCSIISRNLIWFELFQCHRMSQFFHSFDFIHFLRYDVCFINCWTNFLNRHCSSFYRRLICCFWWMRRRIKLNVIKLNNFFRLWCKQLIENFLIIF